VRSSRNWPDPEKDAWKGGANRDAIRALNAATGQALWHVNLGQGPITHELDGKQHLVLGADDTLWPFMMLK